MDVHWSLTLSTSLVILRAVFVSRSETESTEGSMYSAPKHYYVYIMTNRSKTLYAGITSKLENRVFEHKNHARPGFTSRYKVDRLVYFERFGDVHAAIAREKQIKGLLRIKKMALIVSMNPEWKDLSDGWYERHRFEPGRA